LSSSSDLSANASVIFNVLLDFLCFRHLDNAVDLALAAMPPPEPKNMPEISLFPVVSQVSKTFHLLDKHFVDNVVPLISSSPDHAECITKKKEVSALLEKKMDDGLDSALTSLVGWTKSMLSSEQKKSDFKPEENASLSAASTSACHRTCQFLEMQRQIVITCLDGKNQVATLMELGIRFHRVLVDHIQQFSFNSIGGMLAICDVNEYRHTIKKFNIPFLNHLFEVLHSLCNLFIVAPGNLKQVCSEEPIAFLEKSVVLSFVQLRTDYKSSRLSKFFAV
jgi:recyclin-1